jgi:diguanylate cyclase (GGDEF)-like protein
MVDRTQFDGFLAERFADAFKGGKPLSLLVVAPDGLQVLCAALGPAAGERIVGFAGRLLAAAAKPHGLAARFDGETICVALPGVARAAAVALAENVRRAASARPVPLDAGRTAPITISIGVATLEPGSRLTDPAHLTRAAELALAAARRSGPNSVRVFAINQQPAPPGPAGTAAAA